VSACAVEFLVALYALRADRALGGSALSRDLIRQTSLSLPPLLLPSVAAAVIGGILDLWRGAAVSQGNRWRVSYACRTPC